MPPKPLVELAGIDLERTELAHDRIYPALLPHAHELALVDGVIRHDSEKGFTVGYHDVRADEFWCRGHFPTRPIMPGVVIVEAAAQLALVHFRLTVGKDSRGTLLFAGIDEAKFRDPVEPGQKLLLLALVRDMKPRRSRFRTQGVVGGRIVFEGEITGILGPELPTS
ncbi:beta-hydroxyacyl-ACP dehydratase [bacterium]|nr:beta-hydroxyacyl-ACP dehydratase [bacterium]